MVMRRFVRAVALLVLSFGALVALVAVGRGSATAVTWGDLSGWLEGTDPLDAVVEAARLCGLLVAGYVALVAALVVLADLLSAARLVRPAAMVRRAAAGVAVPALRRRVVQAAAASSMAVGSLGSASAAFASAPVATDVVAVSPVTGPENAATAPSATAVPDAPVVRGEYTGFGVDPAAQVIVQPGDSLSKIAAEQSGDPSRWPEWFAANEGRVQADGGALVDPDLIRPEWTLDPPAAPVVDAAPAEQSPPTGVSPASPTYVVQAGDSLWTIVPGVYGVEATTERVDALFDANADRLVRPEWLEIGKELVMPVLPADADVAVSAPEPTATLEPPPAPAPEFTAPPESSLVPAPAPDLGLPPAAEAAVSLPAPPPPSPVLPPTSATPVVTSVPSTPLVPSPWPAPDASAVSAGGEVVADSSGSWLPVVAGLTGSVGLASGLWYAMCRRRQLRLARRRPGARLPVLSERTEELGEVLRASSSGGLVATLLGELSMLASRLGSRQEGVPVAVEVTDEGCELLWSAPQASAPAPWEAQAGGWSWRVLFDPEQPPEPGPVDPCPALVTVGRRDGNQLLANIEAYGSLSVSGDAVSAEAFVRAAVLELGGGAVSNVHVLLVDVAVDGAEHLDRVQPATPVEAVGWLRSWSSDLTETLQGLSSFAARLGRRPRLGTEQVHVAVVRPGPGVDELLALARPGTGVAVVVLGDAPAAARLVCDGPASARFEPLDLIVEPAGVSAGVAVEVAVALDEAGSVDVPPMIDELFDADVADGFEGEVDEGYDLDDGPDERSTVGEPQVFVDEAGDADLTALAATMTGPGAGEAPEVGEAPALPPVLVQVLGRPNVVGRPKLVGKELRVVVFLATHPGGVAYSRLRDKVWNGKPIADTTSQGAVYRARAALGLSGDNELVMPHAHPQNGLSLHPTVGTDVDHIRACLEWAQHVSSSEAIPVLRDALSLVAGEPFDDNDYPFVSATMREDAFSVVADAAHFLARLAMDTEDVETARTAAIDGLKAGVSEFLYVDRIGAEVSAGNPTAALAAFEEMLVVLEEWGLEPSEETMAQMRRVLPRVP